MPRCRIGLLLVAGVLAALFALPAAAWAHVPVLEPSARSDAPPQGNNAYPGASVIPGPNASLALYGYLAPGERFDSYRFKVAEKVTTTVSVLVPTGGANEAFRPVVSVLIAGRILGEVDEPVGSRSTFYEPFSFQTLYQGGEQRFSFEPGQEYVLLVEKGTGDVSSGPYVVGFSGGESFGPAEIGRSLVAVPRIWLGLYGQSPFNPWPVVALVVLLILLGLVVSTVRERRRRASVARRTAGRR
jgi:hypothetical protein